MFEAITQITTPALLFPAISLLLLAYTNRFLVIAQLIRSLYKQLNESQEQIMREQIDHLRQRISMIRQMQAWGVGAFICCTLSMMMLFVEYDRMGSYFFGASLVMLLISLVYSLYEIMISGYALNIQLKHLER
tara:strand:- start:881 stop:1279 length:399 start_codon:yes stop_codon:yes gene_type:complete